MHLNRLLPLCFWSLLGMLPASAWSVYSNSIPTTAPAAREFGAAARCYLPCFANNIMAVVECADYPPWGVPCSKTLCWINNLYFVTCSTTKCPNCPRNQGACGRQLSTLANDYGRYIYERDYSCANWNGPRVNSAPFGACKFGAWRGGIGTGGQRYWTPCGSPGCTGTLNGEWWETDFVRVRCRNNATSESCP